MEMGQKLLSILIDSRFNIQVAYYITGVDLILSSVTEESKTGCYMYNTCIYKLHFILI